MPHSAARSRGYMCVPRFTAGPAITGTAQNGQTLTSTATVVEGTVTSRQWRRNGAPISGATNATYVLQAADIGTTITVAVTATSSRNAASTKTATSAATATVIA